MQKSCKYYQNMQVGNAIYMGWSSYSCIPENNGKVLSDSYMEACTLLNIDKKTCDDEYDEKLYNKLSHKCIKRAENEFMRNGFKQ